MTQDIRAALVPDEMPTFADDDEGRRAYSAGWNACRKAALAAPPVQSDYKLVPVEPTPEMIEAAVPKEWIGHPEAKPESRERWFESYRKAAREHYAAMLAAAPALAQTAPADVEESEFGPVTLGEPDNIEPVFVAALRNSTTLVGKGVQTAPADGQAVAKAIHYPECWDTAAYPTLASALAELYAWFKCSNDAHPTPQSDKREGAVEYIKERLSLYWAESDEDYSAEAFALDISKPLNLGPYALRAKEKV